MRFVFSTARSRILTVKRVIRRESTREFLEGLRLLGVMEALEHRPEGGDVFLDRLLRLLRFVRKSNGRVVGVRHHGTVCCVSGLGELNLEVR